MHSDTFKYTYMPYYLLNPFEFQSAASCTIRAPFGEPGIYSPHHRAYGVNSSSNRPMQSNRNPRLYYTDRRNAFHISAHRESTCIAVRNVFFLVFSFPGARLLTTTHISMTDTGDSRSFFLFPPPTKSNTFLPFDRDAISNIGDARSYVTFFFLLGLYVQRGKCGVD